MDIPKIHESEYRFCLIMWEHEPVTAVDLVKHCQEKPGWKRATTYTVIKRLGERGVLKNENGTITSLVSKDDAQAWRLDVKGEGSNVFYYFILAKNGDVYLSYGYDTGGSHAAAKDGSLIRWLFKLERTDLPFKL